jgi:hypothetical protein
VRILVNRASQGARRGGASLSGQARRGERDAAALEIDASRQIGP